MFGRQSALTGNAGSSNLVEFRAGRMNMIGKTVHPDARKGLVYLTQSDDGLMHFCWKDRTTGKVEDDLIVFPDDFEFKRVEQCKTGRVYVLKFKSSSRRMFFWMQEPKTDKDEELCRRVNELMNNPPSAQRTGSGSDSGDLQYMLNNMSQQQLMQLFGGVGQMGGLTSLLGSMNRSDGNSSRGGGGGSRSSNANVTSTPESNTTARTPSAPKKTSTSSRLASNRSGDDSKESGKDDKIEHDGGTQIDLSSTIVNSEAINVLVSDEDKVNKLAVLLPQNEADSEDKKKQIKETIASAQFQQALTLFCRALQSAQLGPVVSQFELPADAVTAAYAGNLGEFVKALEKALPAGATMTSDKAAASKDETAQKLEQSNNEEETATAKSTSEREEKSE